MRKKPNVRNRAKVMRKIKNVRIFSCCAPIFWDCETNLYTEYCLSGIDNVGHSSNAELYSRNIES